MTPAVLAGANSLTAQPGLPSRLCLYWTDVRLFRKPFLSPGYRVVERKEAWLNAHWQSVQTRVPCTAGG
ncbi:MAG: hypothetical protein JWP47_1067 [Polaromonas sp.]|jgi:hypothetical protein|nr:hypothetical protein [Polaromonas sp.]